MSTLVAVIEPFLRHKSVKSWGKMSKYSPDDLQLMVKKKTMLQLFPKLFGLKITLPNISESQQIWGETHLTHFLIRWKKSVLLFCKQPYCKPVCHIWAENVFRGKRWRLREIVLLNFQLPFSPRGNVLSKRFFAAKCFFFHDFSSELNMKWKKRWKQWGATIEGLILNI